MTTFKILSATATDVVALGDSRDHVRDVLGEKGLELVLDEVGATIPSVQVGLYAPGGTVDGVGLGSD